MLFGAPFYGLVFASGFHFLETDDTDICNQCIYPCDEIALGLIKPLLAKETHFS